MQSWQELGEWEASCTSPSRVWGTVGAIWHKETGRMAREGCISLLVFVSEIT